MNFFNKLFGKRSKRTEVPETVITEAGDASGYNERDNRGTRQDTQDKATAYWMGQRMQMERKDPFVLYTFKTLNDASAALLELPCMHIAKDTQKLICTETLIFGCYSIGDDYEVIVCGDHPDLTYELWEQARASFERHGGVLKNEKEPEKRSKSVSVSEEPVASSELVTFVREDRVDDQYGTSTYRTYKAPDAASAKAFLAQNPVNQKLYYIVVETPEGNYGRDIQGIYKE